MPKDFIYLFIYLLFIYLFIYTHKNVSNIINQILNNIPCKGDVKLTRGEYGPELESRHSFSDTPFFSNLLSSCLLWLLCCALRSHLGYVAAAKACVVYNA